MLPRINGKILWTILENYTPDGAGGRKISFTADAHSLDYDQLADIKPNQNLALNLQLLNAEIVGLHPEGIDSSKFLHLKFRLESNLASRAFGLVRGGWLPASLAADRNNAAILLDRNVVTEIVGRFNNGLKVRGDLDFLDLFEKQDVPINPVLYALEGNMRKTPDVYHVKDQLNEVIGKLQKALPDAKLLIGPESLQGIVSMIAETSVRMAGQQDFLMELAPKISAPIAAIDRDKRFDEILEAADKFNLDRSSLVVLAALSVAMIPNGKCAANGILKLRANYDAARAYNALCDIRSLEMLIQGLCTFPNVDLQLCTQDRDLALFWCSLQIPDFDDNDGYYHIKPHPALLPAQYAERWLAAIS